MSETYHDIPEETLHDVMWEIAEERERRELVDIRPLREMLERKVTEINCRGLHTLEDPFGSKAAVRGAYISVLEAIDEMQGR